MARLRRSIALVCRVTVIDPADDGEKTAQLAGSSLGRDLKIDKIVMLGTVLAIEAHVKICVPALMIERIAELSCAKPWVKIRRSFDKLQVTKFFDLNQRVYLRNEISTETRNLLKRHDITPPKQLVRIENNLEN